jgi:hypothetical protein
MMMESFQQVKVVPAEWIKERIETVRTLEQSDLESYEIVKDTATGEHYLLYSYRHIDLKGDGEEEQFHHFLPLASDDVISLVLDSQPYAYPEHWNRPFLRNGPEGAYIWYDPGHLSSFDADEQLGLEIIQYLMEFKKRGQFDTDSMQAFLKDLDRLIKDSGEQDN